MIEERLADRMRAVLADEPPLGFDPDEVVDRAVRLRRGRRSTVAAAAAVLAIAVAAAVVTTRSEKGEVAVPPPRPDAPCQGVEPGRVPPLDFPGSAPIVARLNGSVPAVITTHLPGVSVQPSETGMIAYDCPPNVGTIYRVTGTEHSVMVYLIHARATLDLAHDRHAGDPTYQLTGDTTAADGARIRTYRSPGDLVAIRFGQDGMVTEVSGQGVATIDQLTALASDPELRF